MEETEKDGGMECGHGKCGRRNASRSSLTGWKARLAPTAFVAACLLMTACSNDQVPLDAQLSISPSTHSTNITELRSEDGHCLFHPDHHVDIPLIMQLNTADGSPIGDAELSVYVDFAQNTYTGLPVLALFDDLNSNGVVDADSELVSGPDDDIARVKTDTWSGTRMMLLRINLSCSFRGEVVVLTGGISARADIEVLADEIILPESE